MSESKNKCKSNETAACCCVDVGTIIDNDDCTAEYQQIFTSEALAQSKLASLTEIANDIASEPCQIESKILLIDGEYELFAKFYFSYGAESLIFQLKLR